MKNSHARLAALVIAVLVAAVTLSTLLTACGSSDPYSGTWTASMQGSQLTLQIVKSGDHWTLTDPTAKTHQTLQGTEVNGKLTVKNPTDATQTMTFERKGDKLVLTLGSLSVDMTKK